MPQVSSKLTQMRQLRQPARYRHHAMRCSQPVAQQLSSHTQVTAVAGKYSTKPYRRSGCRGMKVKQRTMGVCPRATGPKGGSGGQSIQSYFSVSSIPANFAYAGGLGTLFTLSGNVAPARTPAVSHRPVAYVLRKALLDNTCSEKLFLTIHDPLGTSAYDRLMPSGIQKQCGNSRHHPQRHPDVLPESAEWPQTKAGWALEQNTSRQESLRLAAPFRK